MRKQLRQFIKSYDHNFSWGTHDCLHFVKDWVNYVGVGFFDNYNYKYDSAISAKSVYRDFLKRNKSRSLVSVMDKNFIRVVSLPPSGNLIATKSDYVTGVTMGIVEGACGLFVGPDGIFVKPIVAEDIFWEIK